MSETSPQIGDLLQHPVFGVFRVRELQDDRVIAERGDQVFPIPRAVLVSARPARGVVALGAVDPPALRQLIVNDPMGTLAQLMEEVECSPSSTGGWLTGLGVLSTEEFETWWEEVSRKAEEDSRFSILGESIRWREAPPLDLEEPLPLEVGPLAPAGTLPAEELFAFAEMFAEALAMAHAQGVGVVRLRDAVLKRGAGLQLQPRTGDGFSEDVRFALRLCLEQVLGPLPDALKDEELPLLVLAANRSIPPEFLGVCLEAFSEPGFNDGLECLQRLGQAEATWALRRSVPWNPRARLLVGFDTHIGIMKSLNSQTNQDAFLLVGDPELALLAVADGISLCTVGSGDRASGITVRSMRASWAAGGESMRGAFSPRIHGFLESILRRANEAVCDASSKLVNGNLDGQAPMGTTIVTAVVAGNRVHVAALGDSRAYVVSEHGVYPLTFDQNLRSVQLRAELSGREVDWDEPGHALVGFLGHFDPMVRPSLPPLFQRTLTLLPGEWLVLCSDGFTDYAAEDEGGVAAVLRNGARDIGRPSSGASAMEYVRNLTAAANRGGGGDNITVLAFTLSPDEPVSAEDKPLTSKATVDPKAAEEHYADPKLP